MAFALRTEIPVEEVKRLKFENKMLRDDVDCCHTELNQKKSMSLEDAVKKLELSKHQLKQCLNELEQLEEENVDLKTQNEELLKRVVESVKELGIMTERYDRMKVALRQCDSDMDQLKKERDLGKFQIRELTEKIQSMMEEDNPVMAEVKAKVEEWKKVFSDKDNEIVMHQQMIHDLKEKLRVEKRSSVFLQQVIQDRDDQIKYLCDQMAQYTQEMEEHTEYIETVKTIHGDRESQPLTAQERKIKARKSDLKAAKRRAAEAEEAVRNAEAYAAEKDRALIEVSTRLRQYESGTYGLKEAVEEAEIYINQIKIKDGELEAFTKEINQLWMRINDLMDENEHFREKLGLGPGEEVDLTEFRRTKELREWQYKAENHMLTKQVEQLEDERLELKLKIRCMAKDRAISQSKLLPEDDVSCSSRQQSSACADEEIRRKIEFLQKELSKKERELKHHKTNTDIRINKLSEEKKDLEATLKDVLQTMVTNQETSSATAIDTPRLEDSTKTSDVKDMSGQSEPVLDLKSQIHQLIGRNEELRQQLKSAREEELVKATEKISNLERELELMRKSGSTGAVQRPLTPPKDLATNSTQDENGTQSLPDASLALAHQLESALNEVREQAQTISDIQASCKSLDKRLKEKEAALSKAEQKITSKEKVITELRLIILATRSPLADITKPKDIQPDINPALKLAQENINDLQGQLCTKEEALKSCNNLLSKAIQEQENMLKRHSEERRILLQKLKSKEDASLNEFKQTAMQLMQKPAVVIPDSKHLAQLAELEQTVLEKELSLATVTEKLKLANAEIERQRSAMETQANIHSEEISKCSRMKEHHAAQVEALKNEAEDQRSQIAQMKNKMSDLKLELESEKAVVCTPGITMKRVVEQLKRQVMEKNKEIKTLKRALSEGRAESVAIAEQGVLTSAAEKGETINVQMLIDKHTKDLKGHVQELSEEVQTLKESAKAARKREHTIKEEVARLTQELQVNQKTQRHLQAEKEQREKEIKKLKLQTKRLNTDLQKQQEEHKSILENLQKKIKNLESELEKKIETANQRKEKLIRWEESKNWGAKMEKLTKSLKDKDLQNESQLKRLNSLRELHTRMEREKNALQEKLKTRSVAAAQVVVEQTSEKDKEIEVLKRKNSELEAEILTIKQRHDDAMEMKGQREQDLREENLKLASQKMELHFQLEQQLRDNRKIPQLQNEVTDLKETCNMLKEEKEALQKKLEQIQRPSQSCQTAPEPEKPITSKKVVKSSQAEKMLKTCSVPSKLKQSGWTGEAKRKTKESEKFRSQSKVKKFRLESKSGELHKSAMENECLPKLHFSIPL